MIDTKVEVNGKDVGKYDLIKRRFRHYKRNRNN